MEGHLNLYLHRDHLALTLCGSECPLLHCVHCQLVESITQGSCNSNIVGKTVSTNCHKQDYRAFDLRVVSCHGILWIVEMNDRRVFIDARSMVLVTARFQSWHSVRL